MRTNRHRARDSCLRMILSENRCTLFRIMLWSIRASAPGDERIEHAPINLDAVGKRALARMECSLGGDANLVDASLAWRGLDPFDELSHPLLESVCWPEQIGPKGDEEIAVVACILQARSGEQAQGLHHQRQPETLVAAERQQCAAPRLRGIRGRLSAGPDGNTVWERLTQPLAEQHFRHHEGGRTHVEHDRAAG